MLLYHYTDKDLKILSIGYFGLNAYTSNDKKYTIKRLFFYDTIQPKEYLLKSSQYRYAVAINEDDIYNLDNDVLNLKEKFNYDIGKILQYIKDNFIGCCYDVGFLCYCIFDDIIPIKKAIYNKGQYETIS